MAHNLKIREAAVAGMFYPDKKQNLDQELAYKLEESQDLNIKGDIKALVVPHAGYMYSGGVAARAYRQIYKRDINVVVVISPSHTEYFTEISVYDGYAYVTPLGKVEVDQQLAEKIASFNSQIILSDKGHRFDEHALEVQLPFLQKVISDFRLIPIVMGEHSLDNIKVLANALNQVLKNEKALIVASTDLSHFYHDEKAKMLDQVVVMHLENFDGKSLFNDLQSGQCEMCGGGPAIAAMEAARLLGANQSKVLLYRNSGEITGDRSQVVGYVSALFYQS
jgi:AmmeMemoRadiSam system protein B